MYIKRKKKKLWTI